ncbi:Cullin-domain-containing protein [Wolfiporia cocos MD-104 SS10]|uniref:Cullin-domain-containing protein n=1 Tax=Wolfiporia cocos (strain MD-104) TaxID=742152 RepID=A0A2H3J059_WOLCO|nr:Cullin-domain-containing protein [Wolfiporia cocos MD-104 SS10]
MADVFTILSLPQTSNAFLVSPTDRKGVIESGNRATPPRAVDGGARININVLGPPIQSTRNFKDEDLALVRRSIRTLLTKNGVDALPATYEHIYRACRAVVCVHTLGEGLYGNVKMELEQCVGGLARDLLQDRRGDAEWLLPFIDVCSWFEKRVGILQSVLTYLDRVYVTSKRDLFSIKQLAYDLFAQRIFESANIAQRLQVGIKAWVDWERTNGSAHPLRGHIPALIRQLKSHGQYVPAFETFYIGLTRSFYTAESAELAVTLKDKAEDFLQHCGKRCSEEDQRVQDLLPEASRAEVLGTTKRALLLGRLEWLAQNALGLLMDAKKEGNLKKMYRLYAEVGALKVLCAAFKQHVQLTVRNIVKDVEHDEDMVQRLLEFKAFADKLVESSFADEVSEPPTTTKPTPGPSTKPAPVSATKKSQNKEFNYALIDAFSLGFKERQNKPAEMVAKHLDRAMRRGQKGKRDEDYAAELDAVLGLYRFTNDKDVFRAFYHRALAKRLLLERSASDDFEKRMLKKLKEEYDPEFGMGDQMFTDLALSRDIMREYTESRARLGIPESAQKLNVMVLQRSVWPFAARKYDVDLPATMQDELSRYATFYKSRHSGHKLDWDHALGTVTLRARFKNGEKELSVSLYQALVLLLFNEGTEMTFTDLKTQTRMDDAELRRTLQSLALGKKRVLRKTPVGKDVNDGDVFSFHADFTDPRYAVHINSIQVKETPEESKRTQNSIEGDRKHALDAAIVRVMKARKELHYEQLKAATIDAVKNHFVPEVSVIKKRIQGLVEQEYLRRDEGDMNLYIYIA